MKKMILAALLATCSLTAQSETIIVTYEVIGTDRENFYEGGPETHWETLRVNIRDLSSVIQDLENNPAIGVIETAKSAAPIDPLIDELSHSSGLSPNAEAQSFSDPEFDQQNIWKSTELRPGNHNIELAMKIFDRSKRMKIGVIDGGFAETGDITYAAGVDMISTSRGSVFLATDINPSCNYRHGTQVSHVAAAETDNGIGMAGIANADIYASRVFDCGEKGFSTDVADSIRWLSGSQVSGVPTLPGPVDVINMSLSGKAKCPSHVQSAIDLARSRGIILVNAAGNKGGDSADYYPANCVGVITAGAHGFNGLKTAFTNDGDEVDIFANGSGVFTMRDPNTYSNVSGTSFSSPIVAAHAALIKAAEPDADYRRVKQLLQSTSIPFEGNINPGRLDSFKLAQALVGEDYKSSPLTHALLHEDRINKKAYTQTGTGIDICNIYEVDVKKLNLNLNDSSQYFKVFAIPREGDFNVTNGIEVSRSQGTRVLMKNLDVETYSYGISICDNNNFSCDSDIPINLNAAEAFTKFFCN